MRARRISDAATPGWADSEIWRRSQETEASADEARELLDLAAFADNRLDDDEAARIAALLAEDRDAAADIAAARALGATPPPEVDERIVERAIAAADAAERSADIVPFALRRSAAKSWRGAATWGSLAAAMVLAGWLGFDLGNGLSYFAGPNRAPDEVSAGELLDPAPLLMRDFTEGSQI